MLGTLRFALAWIVAAGHLEWALWTGTYAVFSFYVISGYLMCLVMNQRYGFTLRGLRFYALNRALRIYPPYWFACVAGALTLSFVEPETLRLLDPRWQWPVTVWDWLSNFSLVGLIPFEVNPLVPPAWTLRVELFYYVAIALVLGRGRKIALVWACASIAYHVYVGWVNENPLIAWTERYFTIGAASLPFSLGAVVYHFRQSVVARVRHPGSTLAIVSFAWAANYFYAAATDTGYAGPGFYVNCGISSVLLAVLIALPELPGSWHRLDTWLGDLSYPVYLMHMQVGALAAALCGLVGWSPSLFLVAAPLLMLVSWLMTISIDRPIEHLRDRVKEALRTRQAAN
jgi:peptidoglycan/LPS O-acetylase OafA/YrhL